MPCGIEDGLLNKARTIHLGCDCVVDPVKNSRHNNHNGWLHSAKVFCQEPDVSTKCANLATVEECAGRAHSFEHVAERKIAQVPREHFGRTFPADTEKVGDEASVADHNTLRETGCARAVAHVAKLFWLDCGERNIEGFAFLDDGVECGNFDAKLGKAVLVSTFSLGELVIEDDVLELLKDFVAACHETLKILAADGDVLSTAVRD